MHDHREILHDFPHFPLTPHNILSACYNPLDPLMAPHTAVFNMFYPEVQNAKSCAHEAGFTLLKIRCPLRGSEPLGGRPPQLILNIVLHII